MPPKQLVHTCRQTPSAENQEDKKFPQSYTDSSEANSFREDGHIRVSNHEAEGRRFDLASLNMLKLHNISVVVDEGTCSDQWNW